MADKLHAAVSSAVKAALDAHMGGLLAISQGSIARLAALEARLAAIGTSVVALQNAFAPDAVPGAVGGKKAPKAKAAAAKPKKAAGEKGGFPANKFIYFVRCAKEDTDGARQEPAVLSSDGAGAKAAKGTAEWYSHVARAVWKTMGKERQDIWQAKREAAVNAGGAAPLEYEEDPAGDEGEAGAEGEDM